MKYFLVSTVLFFFCSLNGFSQGSDDYRSEEPNIFHEPAPGSLKKNKSSALDVHNVIKWNYSQLVRGLLLFNYERALGEKFSFQIGGGLAYRDFIYEEVVREGDLFEGNKPQYSLGYVLEAGIRYYFGGHEDLKGFYFEPGYNYRQYNSLTTLVYQTPNTAYTSFTSTKTLNTSYSFYDIQFKFGTQYKSFLGESVYGDYYIGLGLRTTKLNTFSRSNSSSSGSYYLGEPDPVISTDFNFQFLMGIKLCFPY